MQHRDMGKKCWAGFYDTRYMPNVLFRIGHVYSWRMVRIYGRRRGMGWRKILDTRDAKWALEILEMLLAIHYNWKEVMEHNPELKQCVWNIMADMDLLRDRHT